MKVESVAVALPSRKVTNHDVLQEISSRSDEFSDNLPATLRLIERLLKGSGSDTRMWLGHNESSLGLTVQASKEAMDKLVDDNKIDLLIVAGVHSELVEPSTANLVAHELGLNTVECFDLKEACDGWMKAAKVAEALMNIGGYRRVMIVNQEFSLTHSDTLAKLFKFSSREQLEWRFPTLTIGEAATATILVQDSNPWLHSNTTQNDLFDLCTITPPWYGAHPISSPRIAKDGPGLFTSYGAELRLYGLPFIVEEFQKFGIKAEDVDILFTHSSSKSDWAEAATQMGLGNKIYDIYASCGNVVSAAIPAAMALALKDGSLRRGMRVLAAVASAGMSFSLAYFRF
ncbi:MAG: 3-oxoacyl-[acyl-carrier-protein] synthase III C-terminal domain-containing protein [bacterium]|nr:3-oxoacyl-[acyl-carrier-protein] synthase III C-terminal domain-containing protein [bacterium]